MNRVQRNILHKIQEQGLDPKVPHVLGKNGLLVPRKSISKLVQEEAKEAPKESFPNQESQEPEEVQDEKEAEVIETSIPKKKPSPFKKKKSESTVE